MEGHRLPLPPLMKNIIIMKTMDVKMQTNSPGLQADINKPAVTIETQTHRLRLRSHPDSPFLCSTCSHLLWRQAAGGRPAGWRGQMPVWRGWPRPELPVLPGCRPSERSSYLGRSCPPEGDSSLKLQTFIRICTIVEVKRVKRSPGRRGTS